MKWAVKILAKILISKLPLTYDLWKMIGIFRHGRMDSSDYPIKIFNLHASRAYPQGLPIGSVLLELGPGDSVATALLGYANNAQLIYLVDVGNFARKDVEFYRSLAGKMAEKGLRVPDLSGAKSLEDILQLCNAQYLVRGLSSLRVIPSRSVDFIWSHSVLEHVRKSELRELLGELRRLLKPGAFSSHNVDYQDHLDHSLNNLRFPESVWESRLFASSGFYTNRVPAVRMHAIFRDIGFEILQENFGKWPEMPISRGFIHSDFQKFTDEELKIRTSHMLLRS